MRFTLSNTKENKMATKPYEQAPFQQVFISGMAKEKLKNPYSKLDDAEADADDFQRGYDTAKESNE
jgi:hypothetical protein